MRLAPDTRQDISAGANKKTRKRQMSGQDPTDEPEPKAQSRSWILDTVDQATVGEVYTLCGATDARLPLIYNWERRTKLEPDVGEHQGNRPLLPPNSEFFQDQIFSNEILGFFFFLLI